MNENIGPELNPDALVFTPEPLTPHTQVLPAVSAREPDRLAADDRVDQYLPSRARTERASLSGVSMAAHERIIELADAELAESESSTADATTPGATYTSPHLSNFRHRSRHRRGMPSPVLKS